MNGNTNIKNDSPADWGIKVSSTNFLLEKLLGAGFRLQWQLPDVGKVSVGFTN